MEQGNLPQILYHATQKGSINSILREGIMAGKRTHVHVTNSLLYVQARSYKYDSIIHIDAHAMVQDGLQILRASSEVFLIKDYIPPEYIMEATPVHIEDYTCNKITQSVNKETPQEYFLKKLRSIKTELSADCRATYPQYCQDVDNLAYMANTQISTLQGNSSQYTGEMERKIIPLIFSFLEEHQDICLRMDVLSMQADDASFTQRIFKISQQVEHNVLSAHKYIDVLRERHGLSKTVSWPLTIASLYKQASILRSLQHVTPRVNELAKQLIDIARRSVTNAEYQTVIIGVKNECKKIARAETTITHDAEVFYKINNDLAEILLQFPLELCLNHQDSSTPPLDGRATIEPALLGLLRSNNPNSGISENGFLSLQEISAKLNNVYTRDQILTCQPSTNLQFIKVESDYMIRALNYHTNAIPLTNYRQIAARKCPVSIFISIPTRTVIKTFHSHLVPGPAGILTFERSRGLILPQPGHLTLEIKAKYFIKTGKRLYTLNDEQFVCEENIPFQFVENAFDETGELVHISTAIAMLNDERKLISLITRAAAKKTPEVKVPTTAQPTIKNKHLTNLARDIYNDSLLLLDNSGLTLESFIHHQNADPFIWAMKAFLMESKLPDDKATARKILIESSVYCIYQDVLYRLQLVERNCTQKMAAVIPVALKAHFLAYFHLKVSSHGSYVKTLHALHAEVFWHNMATDCLQYCLGCVSCHKYKHTTRPVHYGMHSHEPIANAQNEQFFIDTVSLPLSGGFKHALVIVDAFSNFLYAVPLRNTTTPTILHALMHTLIYKGIIPKILISDNATSLIAKPMLEVAKALNIKLINISPYSPSGNRAERYVGGLITKLRVLCEENQKLWQDRLDAVVLAMNCSAHKTSLYPPFLIKNGFMPRHLETLQAPSLQDDSDSVLLRTVLQNQSKIHEIILENRKKCEEASKKAYDEKLQTHVPITVGTIVYLKQEFFQNHSTDAMKKMSHLYTGPYLVIETVSKFTVRIKHVFSNEIFYRPVNISRLRVGSLYEIPAQTITHL